MPPSCINRKPLRSFELATAGSRRALNSERQRALGGFFGLGLGLGRFTACRASKG